MYCGPLGRIDPLANEASTMRRSKMSRRSSRKTFKAGINRQHPKNRANSYFIRGGIRL